MNCLLIGGAPNTGKTTLIAQIKGEFEKAGFQIIDKIENGQINVDFTVCFMSKSLDGKDVKIILNPPSDDRSSIDNCYGFMEKHKPFGIFISSIRDIGETKNYFDDKILKKFSFSNILQIPLAKTTRRNEKENASKWYKDTNLKLAKHILANSPFNLNIK
ncbi:hypothetical protein [Campylobacter curvus]|uniref:hypothetical protein n=1 Tax=Campylobacter curvus TaxID=200 RepID=UPI00147071E4|nr:hypothetical protein [Campylobacter curvus]